jgi:protein-S-isoprenylcysteine O-methyltransferase Ste14
VPSLHTLVDIVVWLCWGLVAVVWIVGALYNSRRAPRARRRAFGGSAWYLLAICAWLVVRRFLGVESVSFRAEPETLRLIGVALLVVATGFTLWARLVLGTMWSSAPVAKERHVLRTDGPYAVTRHPIYTGILGMLVASALALDFGEWLYIVVLVLVFFELRIRDEERLLREAFPSAYDEYRRRVPQLVPGLRLLRSSGS